MVVRFWGRVLGLAASIVYLGGCSIETAIEDLFPDPTPQENAPVEIFRSVGPGNTSPLHATGTISIASDTLTFSSAVPNRVGVGDVIEYDSNDDGTIDSLAFIHGRTSSTVFTVKSAAGISVPDTASGAEAQWTLCRAYTSLANAESATENSACLTQASLENFDSWTGGRDLVTNNEQWSIALYNDAVDSAPVNFDSAWVTEGDNYLRLYTPVSTLEVGMNQRHVGAWGATGYMLNVGTANAHALQITTLSARVEGLQIYHDAPGPYFILFMDDNSGVRSDYVSNNLLNSGPTHGGSGLVMQGGSGIYRVYNNIVTATTNCIDMNAGGTYTAYVYNNTTSGCGKGIRAAGGTVIGKNNISQNSIDSDYAGGFWDPASSDLNLSSDASAPGTAFDNRSVIFNNPGVGDYRLSSNDVNAKDQGIDLSADPFLAHNTDIMGQPRVTWDFGAHEAATAIYRSIGQNNTGVLASGGANALTISSGVATFASPLPDNIGVGDAIEYDLGNINENIFFIYGRADSQNYTIRLADGSIPADFAADQDWRIFRAYTSVANAQSFSENSGIGASVRNFDAFPAPIWTAFFDMVARNEQRNWAFYNDVGLTTPTNVQYYTSDTIRNLRLFAPHAPTEVGVSQRHNGSPGTGITLSSLDVHIDNFTIEGLTVLGDANWLFATPNLNSNFGVKILANNLIINNNTGTDSTALYFQDWAKALYLYNNIIIGRGAGARAARVNGRRVYVYNNTFVGANSYALRRDGGSLYIKNNIFTNDSTSTLLNLSGSVVESENNASRDSMADDFGGAGHRINQTFSFVNPAAFDYRLTSADQGAKDFGMDISSDSHLQFATDIMGNTRGNGLGWDIGAHEAPRAIYRSIGQAPAIATNAIGSMNISAGVATFSAALPDNVGIGDVIVYSSNASIISVVGRIDSQNYNVETMAGLVPANVAGNTDWSIFRAYEWLPHVMSGYENTSIPIGVIDFDEENGNLVGGNKQLNVAVYADKVYPNGEFIQNLATSAANHLYVFVPYLPSHVGLSQRHNGVWDDAKVRVTMNTSGPVLWAASSWVTLDGYQVDMGDYPAPTGNNPNIVEIYADNVTIKNNIVRKNITNTTSGQRGIGHFGSKQGTRIINNIVYGFDGANEVGISLDQFYHTNTDIAVYNNTVYGGTDGIKATSLGSDIFIRNNLLVNNTTDFVHDVHITSSNNVTSDATSPDGAAYQNLSPVFLNEAGRDLRLSLADTAARARGLALDTDSTYAFNTDIAGLTRTVPWDIGASKAVPNYPNLDGLIGLWPLDESPADESVNSAISDVSGSGHHGVLYTGDVAVDKSVPGAVGTALDFDAVNDYVQISDSADLNLTSGEYTLVAWIYPRTFGQNQQGRIIDHGGGTGDGWSFHVHGGGAVTQGLNLQVNNTGSGYVSSPNVISLNTWQQVAVSVSGGNASFYVNGQLAGTRSGLPAPLARALPVRIGMRPSDTNRDFDGLIDEVSVWGRALTQGEIDQIFEQQIESIQPTINISGATVLEGQSAQAVVTLSEAVSWPVTFDWATENGTAMEPGDYTAASNTATIAAGQTVVTLPPITTINDSPTVDPGEYFTVALSAISGAQPGDIVGQVDLVDTDTLPTININSPMAVAEGNDVYFVVSLSSPAVADTSFDYETGNDSAVAPGDYAAVSSTATILAGQSILTLPPVSTVADGIPEATETFTMTISNFDFAVAGTLVGTATIMDNDSGANDITIFSFDVSGITNDDFTAQVGFTGDDNTNATVTLYYCNETHNPSCDPLDGENVVMTPGSGVFTTSVANLPYPYAGGEQLNLAVVAIDTDGVTGSPLTTTITLLPVLDIQEMARMEGQSFEFVVTINKPYAEDVVFNWSTSNNTAIAGNDYSSASGAATIPAGQTQVILPAIGTTDDVDAEPTETFFVNLSAAQNAVIRTSQGIGYIMDNDPGLPWASGLNGPVFAIATEPDGKHLVGGEFNMWDDTINPRAVRIYSDGTEDLSFNLSAGFDGEVTSLVLLPSGKYLAAGHFNRFNDQSSAGLVRLNADGTVDTTFNVGTGATGGGVYSAVLQKDGRAIISGKLSSYNGNPVGRIARVNTDGSFDSSFNTGVGANDTIYANLAIQEDGKVFAAGRFTEFNGTPRARLVRLNTNGSVDTSFDPGLGVVDGWTVQSLYPLSDGKLMVGGDFSSYDGVARARIARVNADGSLDTSFNPGTGPSGTINAFQMSEGKLLVGGAFNNYNGTNQRGVIRLNSDGTLDTTFNTGQAGISGNPDVRALHVDVGGKIVATGNFTTYNGTARKGVVRINSDGSLDATFDPGSGLSDRGSTTFILADGRIVVAGGFRSYRGEYERPGLAKFNADNSLDLTFEKGVGSNNAYRVQSIVRQSDGKFIVGGDFQRYDGVSRNRIARLNADGTLDTTFVPGTGFNHNSSVLALGIQSDGKIYAGGSFTSFNGDPQIRLVRLNVDGSFDGSFDVGEGFNNTVNGLVVQSDDKVIVVGNFTEYNTVARNRMVRVDTDGTLDMSFDPGTGLNGGAESVALQADGKVLVGGWFNTYNGVSRGHMARINSDGSIDTSFVPGFTFGFAVLSLAPQADGKILAGGYFNSNSGSPRNHIARVLSGGGLDTSFDPPGGTNATVWAVAVNNNGRLHIGGEFSKYGGEFAAYEYTTTPPNPISVGNMMFGSVTSSSFVTSVGYYGDANENSGATLYYCSETANPGCDPQAGPGQSSTPMVAAAGVYNGNYTVTVNSGLTSGHTYNIRVIVTDDDGVTGSLTASPVTLP